MEAFSRGCGSQIIKKREDNDNMNINLVSLNDSELIRVSEEIMNNYELQKYETYKSIQGKDIMNLEKNLQRVAIFEGKGRELHQRAKDILASDFSIRDREYKPVKSLYEIERERNGWGRYSNNI